VEGNGCGLIDELLRLMLGGSKENHSKAHQDSHCPSRSSNPIPTEYENSVKIRLHVKLLITTVNFTRMYTDLLNSE
jgi:hypothetical protein